METGEIIRKLCHASGTSVTKLEEELGFGNGSLTRGSSIRSDRLHAVAKYFGVSMEYLLTGVSDTENYLDPRFNAMFIRNPELVEICYKYANMSSPEKNLVCQMMGVSQPKKSSASQRTA